MKIHTCLYVLITCSYSLFLFIWLICSDTGDLNDLLKEIEVMSSKICKFIDLGDKWYVEHIKSAMYRMLYANVNPAICLMSVEASNRKTCVVHVN